MTRKADVKQDLAIFSFSQRPCMVGCTINMDCKTSEGKCVVTQVVAQPISHGSERKLKEGKMKQKPCRAP